MAIKKHREDDRVITTIRNWELGKSKNKETPFVRVSFEGYISYTGFLTSKTIANTIKTLQVMGFKYANVKDLCMDDALDTSKEYSCVIGEVNEHNGKTYYRAKFVNSLNATGSKTKKSDLDDDFDIDLSAYGNDEEAMEDMSKASSTTSPGFAADDIPF